MTVFKINHAYYSSDLKNLLSNGFCDFLPLRFFWVIKTLV